MLKDTTYQEKFVILQMWIEEIIDAVKKDLKVEHLSKDKNFCRRYFLGKNPSQVDQKAFCEAYVQDIAAGNVGLGEFIASRWLLKNTDIYGYFEEKLKKITPDFEQLNELDEKLSESLIKESLSDFGAKKTYIFSVFNSVVFPKKVYDNLKENAEKETHEERNKKEEVKEKLTLVEMEKRHDREMRGLKDRYEKKLSGLQKKYLTDTAALKKEIERLKNG